MNCPRDQVPLRKWRFEHIDSHICPQCAGLFVELDQERAPQLSRANVNPTERMRILADGEDPVVSPATGRAMVPFLFRGVEVDYCEDRNAVWFDPGEIEKANLKPKPAVGERTVKHRLDRDPFDGLRAKTDIAHYVDFGILGDFLGGVFDAF